MTGAQLKEMAADPLIDIGGNGEPFQPGGVSWRRARGKIVQGREMLEARLGKPLSTFAYPYGTRQTIPQKQWASTRNRISRSIHNRTRQHRERR